MKTTLTCAKCGGIMYITRQFFTKYDVNRLLTVYTCMNDDCEFYYKRTGLRYWTFETEKYINPVRVIS